MTYFGDIRLGNTLNAKFTTVGTDGAPTQLAGVLLFRLILDQVRPKLRQVYDDGRFRCSNRI